MMLRHFALFGVVSLLAVTGCGDATIEVEEELDDLPHAEGMGDHLEGIPADALGSMESPLADGTPQVVFVNFGGPTISNCPGSWCDDAAANKSSLIGSTFGRSTSLDFAAYSTSGSTARAEVLSKLKSYFSKYNVKFVTSRPTSGPYTMVVISPSAVGPEGNRGSAYLDCNNSRRNAIVFIYRISGVSTSWIARYAAHELGHSLGLMHVKLTGDYYDVMDYKSRGSRFTTSYLDSATNPPGYTCFGSDTKQNAPLTLAKNVGCLYGAYSSGTCKPAP